MTTTDYAIKLLQNRWVRFPDGQLYTTHKAHVLMNEDELFNLLCLVARRNQKINFLSVSDILSNFATAAFNEWKVSNKDYLSIQPGDVTNNQMAKIKQILRGTGAWTNESE